MEVIVIESEAFQEMQKMFKSVCKTVQELATENKALKAKVWINAHEAAEITSYNEKTIRNRKHEIGFKSNGGLLLFKHSDVIAWMDRGYIGPK